MYTLFLFNQYVYFLSCSGDHDLTIPNTGTEEWIKKLDLTVVNDWRPWLVDGQIAG